MVINAMDGANLDRVIREGLLDKVPGYEHSKGERHGNI